VLWKVEKFCVFFEGKGVDRENKFVYNISVKKERNII
jgi:hypothetical protein